MNFQKLIDNIQKAYNSKKLVLWGAGLNGDYVADYFIKASIPIHCFVDMDATKQKRSFCGVSVY